MHVYICLLRSDSDKSSSRLYMYWKTNLKVLKVFFFCSSADSEFLNFLLGGSGVLRDIFSNFTLWIKEIWIIEGGREVKTPWPPPPCTCCLCIFRLSSLLACKYMHFLKMIFKCKNFWEQVPDTGCYWGSWCSIEDQLLNTHSLPSY